MAGLKDQIADIIETGAQQQARKDAGKDTERADLEAFFGKVVAPAFAEFGEALKANGRTVQLATGDSSAHIIAFFGGKRELDVRVDARDRMRIRQIAVSADADGNRFTAEQVLATKQGKYGIAHLTMDDMIHALLQEYRSSITAPTALYRE